MDDGAIAEMCATSGAVEPAGECVVNCTFLCDYAVLVLGNDGYNANQTNGTQSITQAAAYGYGFIMVVVISLLSLLGVTIVPFIQHSSRLASVYKQLITLLIAMGVSALISDALLHLIPNALSLHSHEQDQEDLEEEKQVDEREVVWKMCAVLGGVASFFLLELLLRACSSRLGHSHSHSVPLSQTRQNDTSSYSDTVALIRSRTFTSSHASSFIHSHSDTTHPRTDTQEFGAKICANANGAPDISTTVKTGSLEAGKGYGTVSSETDITDDIVDTTIKSKPRRWERMLAPVMSIKPLAWVIIVGDGLHNLTDGLAIGVAISQSLGLGLSTAIAILFHEIPHELSDYAILLHTGMSWYKALLLNFLSALTALVGFFIGVAIGTDSQTTNDWLLAVIAGQFLYIALVDLLPEIIRSQEQGWTNVLQIGMSVVGFAVGFAVLLLIAIFEDDINVSVE